MTDRAATEQRVRGYLYALEPTGTQIEKMLSHCGAARFTYNWCWARVKANWDQRSAETSYGIAEEDRTPWVQTNFYSLMRDWREVKDVVAPWWPENSKTAYETGCRNFSYAVRNQGAGRSGRPRFKARHRSGMRCAFFVGARGGVRLGRDDRHVQIPVIGVVRTHESTRKLANKVAAGAARVKSATLSFQRGRWHISFAVEVAVCTPSPRAGRTVGVDLGLTSLAVLSTGERVRNPRRLDASMRKLRRAQRRAARRRGPDRETRREPSIRWRKAQARVDQIHTRVANLRRNDTHQFTTRLVRDFDTIVIEDLNVAGMIRYKNLARHITSANWGEIRWQLTYKAEWHGVRVVLANRYFASSKTCSACGEAKTKLILDERKFKCSACGLILDRDENAARNLAALANTPELLGELPDGSGVRPAQLAGTAVALPREGSTTQRHLREGVAR